jgi:hypothetical protein
VYADARQWNTPIVGAANAPGGGGNPQSKEYPYRLENQVQEQTWPTPTTQETPHYEITLTATGRREGVGEGATSHALNLCDAARLAEYAEMIADPSTPERIGALYGPQDEAPGNTHGSPRASHPESREILNPRWVEVLMGVPVGWVMATCDAPLTAAQMSLDFWGMELYPPQQSEPLGCCGESLQWKTPSTMETEGGVKEIRENATAQTKLRDQVAHQGAAPFWPPPLKKAPYLPRK